MKTFSKSPPMLLKFMCITLLPVPQAQKVIVQLEVTGYLGHDVTLQCNFIPGPNNDSIIQVQWELRTPEAEKLLIIASNKMFGVLVHDTFLKERVQIEEQSLIIRDVEMTDTGLYTCVTVSFPSGSYEATTKLVVKEQVLMLPRMIATGVFVLIVVTMIATTNIIIIRIRHETSVRYRVCTDTAGPVTCD